MNNTRTHGNITLGDILGAALNHSAGSVNIAALKNPVSRIDEIARFLANALPWDCSVKEAHQRFRKSLTEEPEQTLAGLADAIILAERGIKSILSLRMSIFDHPENPEHQDAVMRCLVSKGRLKPAGKLPLSEPPQEAA